MMGAGWKRSRVKQWSLGVAAAVLGVLLVAVVASASHPEVSLSGSNFEIDTDANLKQDDASPSIDWASGSVDYTLAPDLDSGAGDDSFGQGAKEDTAVPAVVTGSIPPNKSDLLNFGVYLETVTVAGVEQQFLNLFWHRVQEPQGTTNMDFEFNQSDEVTSNDVTPVRTAGDLLIQYDLAQGGTNPQLFLSRWVTSGNPATVCEAANKLPCWGDRVNLSAAGDATGSINSTAIDGEDSGGLVGDDEEISPRTFGEAQLDFDELAGGTGCTPFGSAYLKSRSSDSFTSALKDFIAPTTLEFSNCGAIEITKTGKDKSREDADGSEKPLSGAHFQVCTNDGPYDEENPCDPAATGSDDLVTDADGIACVDNLSFGDYFVTETSPPDGYAKDDSTTHTVAVNNGATCDDDPYGGESEAFTDTPLTNLSVHVESQSDGQGDPATGATESSIECKDDAATPAHIGNSPEPDTGTDNPVDLLADEDNGGGLPPGTYTCTIVVDP